jgi:hypothetical protein
LLSDNGANVVNLNDEHQLGHAGVDIVRTLAADGDICASILADCNFDEDVNCQVTAEDAARCLDSVKLTKGFRDRVAEGIQRQVGAFYVYRDIIVDSVNDDGVLAAPCGLATHDVQVPLPLPSSPPCPPPPSPSSLPPL